VSLARWKSAVGVALVFAIGLLCGAALVVILQARLLRSPDFPERMAVRMQQALAEELDLTEAQRGAIDRAMKASRDDMRALHEEMGPRLDQIFERMRKAIEAELTPEQKKRLDELRGKPPLLGRLLGGPRFGRFGPRPGGPFDGPGVWDGEPRQGGSPGPRPPWDDRPDQGGPPPGPPPGPGSSPTPRPEPPPEKPLR
jgi:hypothetical protein